MMINLKSNPSYFNWFKNENKKLIPSQIIRRVVCFCLAFAILNLANCSYYTVKDVASIEENISEEIASFNSVEKYVVIHSNNMSWHLRDMVVNDDEHYISGIVEAVNERHKYKKQRDEKRVHRYKKNRTNPLNEVHFYLKTPSTFQLNEHIKIPLQDINRMSVNDKNTGKAIANVLLTSVGVVFTAVVLVAALKSSCPFVYVKNGQEYAFVGELYPGTITPNMQQNDYLGLSGIVPENGIYTIKIANQLKEIQYTDQLQLLLMNHPKGVEVLIDSKGGLQTFRDVISPFEMQYDGSEQNLEFALRKDNNYDSFNASKTNSDGTRHMVFKFKRPKNTKEAKLYVTAKNSVWLDYIFGKFNAQFGTYYNSFQKNQQTIKKEKLDRWREGQNIPLSVYVKSDGRWQLVERLNAVGPLAMRNLAVPLDLDAIDEEVIEVKLETGFMFWEVDFVGIDYSENIDLHIQYIDPLSAIDKNGNDVAQLLKSTDEKYFVQANIGDEVIVQFPSIESENPLLETTVFLMNRGYYNYIRDYKGAPDVGKLRSFQEDGAFTRFSENAYFEFINYGLKNMAQNE